MGQFDWNIINQSNDSNGSQNDTDDLYANMSSLSDPDYL